MGVAEISNSIYRIVYEIIVKEILKQNLQYTSDFDSILPAVFFITYSGSYNTMLVLTIDRFVLVIDPLRYKSRMTRKRVQAMIAFAWVMSFIAGISFVIWRESFDSSLLSVSFVPSAIYLMFVAVTYILVANNLKRPRGRVRRTAGTANVIFKKHFTLSPT